MDKTIRASIDRLLPQPLIGIGTATVASLAVAAVWIAQPGNSVSISHTLLSLILISAVVAAYQFPIHLRRQSKVYMASVPYYLMAVLLPVPLAATAAALGALIGELSVRVQRNMYASDIATEAGRRAVIVLLAALVAHVPGGLLVHTLTLLVAALVLGGGDIMTFPLVVGPMGNDPPLAIIVAVAKEACLTEGVQYLLGLLGALAATEQPWAVVLLIPPTILVYRAGKSAREMQDSTRQLLESMADTVDMRDPYTGGHSRRVTELCAAILAELAIQGPEAELILAAARVHDIGKIGIPDAMLHKPGPLTAAEWAIMQTHPQRGAELLQRYADFSRGVAIVRHHHESWDGSGYPQRLRGAEIPFGARVIAVADSFDAMTSDRPYRRSMTVEQAATILRHGRGRQWDAAVVDALLRSIAPQLGHPATPPLHLVPATDSAADTLATTG